MRKRLGEAHWHAFVRYAAKHHKRAFLDALLPPNAALCCAGKLARRTFAAPTPCTRTLCLATTPLAEVRRRLASFHMDHTYDVSHICDVWSRALPPNPLSWDDGVCGPLIAHLLASSVQGGGQHGGKVGSQ